MKNIGNTENKEEDQFVQNDLTVGNDIFTEGITTSTLNAGGITTETLIASENISIPTFGSINFGINPFKYSRGNFTPRSRCIEDNDGSFENINWHDSSNQTGTGYYERYGNVVTVYFNTSVQFGGEFNDLLYSLRIPVVDNLPFTCGRPGAVSIESGCTITDYSFPNGYILGIAAPLTITMDGTFTGTIYESGMVLNPALPPLYVEGSPWTSDGKTVVISCGQSQFLTNGLTTFGGLVGPAYNFNVIVTGSYTSQFRGTITYFTNE